MKYWKNMKNCNYDYCITRKKELDEINTKIIGKTRHLGPTKHYMEGKIQILTNVPSHRSSPILHQNLTDSGLCSPESVRHVPHNSGRTSPTSTNTRKKNTNPAKKE